MGYPVHRQRDLAFRILRGDEYRYTGVGTALGVDPGTGGILRFPTSLPIQQGDRIGIGAVAGDSDVGVPESRSAFGSNYWAYNALGEPADGSTAIFTPEPGLGRVLVQATVKFCSVPNLKRMKKAAAKQALAAVDCGVRVKKKETHKRKFRGKVLKQKVPAGTTGSPGLVVPIVIGRK